MKSSLSIPRHLPASALACVVACQCIASAENLQIIHSFPGRIDGSGPWGKLMQGSDGRIYGTTRGGGSGDYVRGTVFALQPDGSGYTVIRSVDSVAEGGPPSEGVVQGPDGRLYGMTEKWGAAIFSISTDGTSANVVHRFESYTDGSYPQCNLVVGLDGRLYGATSYGGGPDSEGAVFAVYPDGTGFTVLHRFPYVYSNDSQHISVMQSADGRIFGVTTIGGLHGDGTLFVLNPDGSDFRVLHDFNYAVDGAHPWSPPVEGADAHLYGTTSLGVSSGKWGGAVYAIDLDGSQFRVLHHFNPPTDGSVLFAGVIQGADGRLYGSATYGAGGNGSVYAVNRDGSGFEVLHRFPYRPGEWWNPVGEILQGADGRLYGTTFDGGVGRGGTVYALQPDGSGFVLLHEFDSDFRLDDSPSGGVRQGTDGRLYGTTSFGGANGAGSVFAVQPNGTGFSILHDVDPAIDGSNPSRLSVAANGRFVAITSTGGQHGFGTLFSVGSDGTDFRSECSNAQTLGYFGYGNRAFGQLTAGPDGRLYGTTGGMFAIQADGSGYTWLSNTFSNGPLLLGSDGRFYGTDLEVFAVQPDGTGYTALHAFTPNDAVKPEPGLLEGPDGRIYGVSARYGIFSIEPDGTDLLVLHRFGDFDGGSVKGPLTFGPDGRLYGTARSGGGYEQGTAFAVRPDGYDFQVVHHFSSLTDGSYPNGPLILGTDGRLYGTTERGGAFSTGTVFALAVKKPAEVEITDTIHVNDGAPHGVTVTTQPCGLKVNVTYNTSPTVPSGTGNYTVVATIDDAEYAGSDVATLVIAPPDAIIGAGVVFGGPARFGSNVRIDRNVTFRYGALIGSNVTIGRDGTFGSATIGSNVTIGRGFTAGNDFTVRDGSVIDERVAVGDDVKLGYDVHIGRDVVMGYFVRVGDHTTIGQGCTIDQRTFIGGSSDPDIGLYFLGSTIDRDVVIGSRVRIGDQTTVGRNGTIGDNATIGTNVTLGEKVTVAPEATVADGTSVPAKGSVP